MLLERFFMMYFGVSYIYAAVVSVEKKDVT